MRTLQVNGAPADFNAGCFRKIEGNGNTPDRKFQDTAALAVVALLLQPQRKNKVQLSPHGTLVDSR